MHKMRSVIFCCGLAFLITTIFVGNVWAKSIKKTAKRSVPSGLSVGVADLDKISQVNINTADIVSLQKVKGIGKKKAKAIVDYRNRHGQFKSLDDLLVVKCRGINKKWLNKVSGFLTI